MKTTAYPGIDYTPIGDTTNRDTETGIRYGIISERSLGDGYQCDDPIRQGGDNLTHMTAVDEVKQNLWRAVADWCPDRKRGEIVDAMWEAVEQEFNERYEEDCDTYRYEKEGYVIQTASNGELFVIDSPYYTYAQLCSPCVPGAGNLDTVFEHDAAPNLEGDEYEAAAQRSGFPKVYCLGPDWFDDEKAPYPVFNVVKPIKE